jgi:hypothetical protein
MDRKLTEHEIATLREFERCQRLRELRDHPGWRDLTAIKNEAVHKVEQQLLDMPYALPEVIQAMSQRVHAVRTFSNILWDAVDKAVERAVAIPTIHTTDPSEYDGDIDRGGLPVEGEY